MSESQTTLCILGASGDLTSRSLLPALAELLTEDPERRVHLIGAGGHEWSDQEWRAVVGTAFAAAVESGAGSGEGSGGALGGALANVLDTAVYRRTDITDADQFRALLAECRGRTALYFAVPPAVAVKGCEALEQLELPEGLVLALEKPFGTDETSAASLNALLRRLVPEEQIYRIDHFLGRSTVLNVLGLRFANRVFEPVWSNEHIESVSIRFDETLGLEGRAGYYDTAGALVDMIQSHLLQVLAIVGMNPPASLGSLDFRDEKSEVLRATKVWNDDPVAHSRRARYSEGSIDGRALPDYAAEPGVDPARGTETLAEVTFAVETSRWAGVPFTIRSGKGLAEKHKEIVLHFRRVAHLPREFEGSSRPSMLRLSLGPDRMALELNLNGPGEPFHLDRASLETEFTAVARRPYTEVLEGILDGDATLSVRGDTAEQCWRIVQPILDAWKRDQVPLDEYPAGSKGPEDWPPL
jgi:glucose-6-phosphate 1-dehydrogenase